MLFLNKQKRERDILVQNEIKRRKKIVREQQIIEQKEKKEHKKWLKQHKKDYIKKLKTKNPKMYRWYKLRKMEKIKLPLVLDFIKWIILDVLRGKKKKLWGVYLFVGMPGQGKTLSMVAHMERVKKDNPNVHIYTNFNYKGQTGEIKCWQDIVYAKDNSIIAIDEAHLTFESTDFKNFPPEILSELSLNRKSRKQILCSTQIYERINKNFRDLANYVVICKNHFNLDRWFSNYYFSKTNYDKRFEGQRARADMIRAFVASNDLYNQYNTLQKIEKLAETLEDEEVLEKDVIKALDNVIELSSYLDSKEVRYIEKIRTRIKEDIQKKQFEDKQKQLFDMLQEENQILRNELNLLK